MRLLLITLMLSSPVNAKTIEMTGRVTTVTQQGTSIDILPGDEIFAALEFSDYVVEADDGKMIRYTSDGTFSLEVGDFSYRQIGFNYAANQFGHFMGSTSLAVLEVDGRQISSTSLRFGPQASLSIEDLGIIPFREKHGFFSVVDGPLIEYRIDEIVVPESSSMLFWVFCLFHLRRPRNERK